MRHGKNFPQQLRQGSIVTEEGIRAASFPFSPYLPKRTKKLIQHGTFDENGAWVLQQDSDEQALSRVHSGGVEPPPVYEGHIVTAVASGATSMAASASSAVTQMFKVLGGLGVGAGLGVALGAGAGGGSGGDSVGTKLGGGNGINTSISDALFYSSGQVNASVQAKDLLNAFESGTQGAKWGTQLGQGAVLTYSFSLAGVSKFLGDYVRNNFEGASFANGLESFTQAQKNLALQAMASYVNVSNLQFVSHLSGQSNDLNAEDTSTHSGDIRWSNTSNMPNSAGVSYFPNWYDGGTSAAVSGDIWITDSQSYVQNPSWEWARSYVQFLFIHELGHALGLSHPHETSPDVSSEDFLKYSVMSYKDYFGDPNPIRQSAFFPSSMMLNDIAAIQYLYGVNTKQQLGNDVYSWGANDKIYQTIYDAGGIDTIDASNQLLAVQVDLNPGRFSTIGVAFGNGQTDIRDALAMSYAVEIDGRMINLIENAWGSNHDDVLIGNDADNQLSGRGGSDVLTGGVGADQFVFNTVCVAGEFDHIRDFSLEQGDKVALARSVFTELDTLGELLARYFSQGAGVVSGLIQDSRVAYNTNDGHLYYDADGSGAQAAVLIAVLDDAPMLTAASLLVV